jgi:hypothetical protein
MKRTALATSILVGCLSLKATPRNSQAPTAAEVEWLSGKRLGFLDPVLPMRLPIGGIVAYGSYHELGIGYEEAHFVVRYSVHGFEPDRLSATVRVPTGRSLQLQLIDLHRTDLNASVERLIDRLAVRRATVDTSSCPALVQRMNALTDIAVTVPDRRLFTVGHSFTHQFTLAIDQFTMQVTVRDQESPLVRWAGETNEVLVACAAKSLGGP